MSFYSIPMQYSCYNRSAERRYQRPRRGQSGLEIDMESVPQKHCSKCGETKPYSEFHKNAGTRDGLSHWCKVCRKQATKEYYWRDPELQRRKLLERRKQNPSYMKRYSREPTCCAACREIKDVSAFGVDRSRKSGLNPYCKTCEKARRAGKESEAAERGRRWYVQERARVIERSRQWSQENRQRRRQIGRRYSSARRAWKRGRPGAYTLAEWDALCAQYDFHCLCCGRQVPEITLSPDHVVPLARGGSNDIANIQPLCLPCNWSKNAKTVDYRPRWQT